MWMNFTDAGNWQKIGLTLNYIPDVADLRPFLLIFLPFFYLLYFFVSTWKIGGHHKSDGCGYDDHSWAFNVRGIYINDVPRFGRQSAAVGKIWLAICRKNGENSDLALGSLRSYKFLYTKIFPDNKK